MKMWSLIAQISWVNRAFDLLERDQRRSADTHLIKLECPALQRLDIYLKMSPPIRPGA